MQDILLTISIMGGYFAWFYHLIHAQELRLERIEKDLLRLEDRLEFHLTESANAHKQLSFLIQKLLKEREGDHV